VLQATSSEGGKLSRGGAHIGEEGSGETLRGIYSSQLGADGHYTDILCVPRGTAAPMSAESIQTDAHYLQMEGREVFKLAVRRLAEINESVVVENGFDISQVDWFASHQANKRILLAVAKSIGLPEEKVLMNLERFGNTSAASVPILLAESEQKGLIKPGDLIVLSAFGGGVTWGSILLRW
jgi:3-oxoacyl-[acyl-carrier-protein] synthase-3